MMSRNSWGSWSGTAVLECARLLPVLTMTLVMGAVALVAGLNTAGMLSANSELTPVHEALGGAGPARLGATALGVLVFGNDLRHRTLGRWLPYTFNRRAFLGSKYLASALLGVACGLVSLLGAAVAAVASGVDGSSPGSLVAAVVGTAIAFSITGIIGCAIAVLTNSVVVPLVALLAVLPAAEAVAAAVRFDAAHWLPATAASEIVSPVPGAPPVPVQVAVLVAWSAGAAVAGWLSFSRRDIVPGPR